jgi:hypothetical protein
LTIVLAVPALAHHSRPVFYEMDKTISVTGVVVTVQIINPHAKFDFEVTEANGTKSLWRASTHSGAALARAGFSSTKPIAVGDKITFEGNPARDPSAKGMLINNFILPSGQKLCYPFTKPCGEK